MNIDACLKNMADWYAKNRRDMTAPEFDAILKKHCEAEQQKMVKFIDSEAGQARFKTLLRERKPGSQLPAPGTKHPVHCVKCGWEGTRTHGPLAPCPSCGGAVGAHFGFDSGLRSFPYVALWSKDRKVLEQNLGAVRRVATAIITALAPE